MALPAFLKKIMGSESKKEETAEKKLPAKTYAKVEKAEGAKSTSPKTKPIAKKTVAKATTRMPKKK
jgi:hypothetical protein